MIEQDGKAFVSATEVAQWLGVGRSTVYRMIDREELPAFHVGPQRLVIPVESVHEYLSANRKVAS